MVKASVSRQLTALSRYSVVTGEEGQLVIGNTGSLEELVKLAPAMAIRLGEDGAEEEVPSRLVQPGDRLRVRQD